MTTDKLIRISKAHAEAAYNIAIEKHNHDREEHAQQDPNAFERIFTMLFAGNAGEARKGKKE